MKKAREVEFEVLPKESAPGGTQFGDDPLIGLVARLMDSVFSVPGTRIKFGLDPIIGLIPGFGDTASALVSVLLIFQSARYGLPKVVIARMAGNVLLNAAVGAVPVAGDVFSVWFKSNKMNYALLQKHAGTRKKAEASDWAFVIVLLGLLLAGIALIITIVVAMVTALFKAAF